MVNAISFGKKTMNKPTNNDRISDSFWDINSINLPELSSQVSVNAQSFLWSMFKGKIKKYFGKSSGMGLKSIEIGCGLGKFSVLLGLWGFRPTLLDTNVSALSHAELLFNHFGLNPELIETDALDLPEYLCEAFDVSVSFGLAEHFVGEERKTIIQNHLKALRPGGLCFLQVPNALSPCYRIAFGMRKLLGLWPSDVPEIPYTQFELKKIAKDLNLEEISIVCTQRLWSDFDYWILNNVKSLFKKMGLYQFPPISNGSLSSYDLRKALDKNIPYDLGFLSRTFTYPLILIARRKSSSQ